MLTSCKVSGLTVVLVVNVPRPLLHHSAIPHIHFPAYTRQEALSILSRSPLQVHTPRANSSSRHDEAQLSPVNDEDSTWLWSRFTAAVWDSLGQGAARDVISFREVCVRLWKPFIQPILDGNYGIREFSKLMVKNRALFQSEASLNCSIVPITTTRNSKPDSVKGKLLVLSTPPKF